MNVTTWHTNKVRAFPVRDLHENAIILNYILVVAARRRGVGHTNRSLKNKTDRIHNSDDDACERVDDATFKTAIVPRNFE